MNINLAKIDFAYKNQGGDAKPEVKLTQTITENGLKTFNPPAGSVYSSAEITVDVPQPTLEENKTQEITSNGQTIIAPTEGNDAMKQVTLNVNVPEKTFKTQTKTETVTENKTISVTPDEGFDGLTKVDVTVNVPTSGGYTFKYGDNLWPGNSTIKIRNSLNYGLIFKINDQTIEDNNFVTNETGIYTLTIEGNTSSLYQYFLQCHSLQSIPLFDTSNTTNFNGMFSGCSSLATVPSLDTSNGSDFSYMFHKCSALTTVPSLDTSNGTDFYGMFYECSALTTVPSLDTSNGSNFSSMFYECSALTTVPSLDTSNGTDFFGMFYECSALTTVPSLDTSNGTDFSYMFYGCSALTTVPSLDTSNGSNFSYMFYGCSALTTIPSLDTSNGSTFTYMFSSCDELQEINGIDFSSLTSNPSSILGYSQIKGLTKFILNGILNFSCPKSVNILSNCADELDYDTIKSWLTAASKTTNSDAKELDFATYRGAARTVQDQNGELAALVTACSDPSKNWTIKNLTVNP